MVGGLGDLANDNSFVAVTRNEMAEAMRMPMSHFEDVALGLLNGRSGRATSATRKKSPIPVPPSAPDRPSRSTELKPKPQEQRKKRLVTTFKQPLMGEEADTKV